MFWGISFESLQVLQKDKKQEESLLKQGMQETFVSLVKWVLVIGQIRLNGKLGEKNGKYKK